MDLQGYRYRIYGISGSQRLGELFRFLCVFRFPGKKITQRAQLVEKENWVLLGWCSIDGFTGLGGSSTGPVWFLCRDCSSWRGSSLSTEVCGWAILEVSDNPQKVSPPGGRSNLQNILIKLVASKEEADIAKAIEKARKSSQAEKSFSPPVTAGKTREPSNRYRRGRGSRRCRKCG